ncbi:hypothetical protein [Microbacterium sp. 179-I 3D4 NHS]|uniref:hypothetical protein n=1 Tax=Microbacterium sp. 179-I 3D4 NHS TaxID=3142381 RepID=UPI0039A109CD
MADADEVVELRALQRKAYGRDGRLTPHDAARLEHLLAHRPHVDPATPPAVGVPPEDPSASVGPSDPLGAAFEPGAEASPAPTTRRPLGGAWRQWAGAAAGALLVGLGAGWLLFHPVGSPAVPLTSEQQRWQDAFAAEEGYDRGSVRAITVVDDVVVWIGTKQQGDWTCLVLGDGTTTSPACNPTESVRTSGLYASLTSYVSEGTMRQVSANLHLAADGAPAVVTNTAQYSPTTTTGWASAREERIAANLVRLGFDPFSVWIAGYDDGVPVWIGVRSAAGQTCLVYDGSGDAPEMACDQFEAENTGRPGITLVHVDPETGLSSTLVYTLGPGAQYLTITREQGFVGERDD